MNKNQVPQDKSETYSGHCKLLYATDTNGEYSSVHSSGWDVEEHATLSALAQIHRLKLDAWTRARQGLTSPLEYHMYNQRMDVPLLSQTSGLFKWRIKRHFQPVVFKKLNHSILNRYCEALGIDNTTLNSLPEKFPEK